MRNASLLVLLGIAPLLVAAEVTRPIGLPVPAETRPEAEIPHPLAWDALVKEYTAKPGDTTNMFAFTVTNTASSEVVINQIRPSCGCTVAQLPSNPWKLAPGEHGTTYATMNFAGKSGLISKALYVDSSAGQQTLIIRVNIPEVVGEMANRVRNQQIATADRQAVFRGDCAVCHAAPAAGKTGEALYQAACAICHAPEHRANMVTDLAMANTDRDAAFWKQWISKGRENTLMPAFASVHGGPLNDEQIQSLIDYALKKFPTKATKIPALH